MKFRRNNLFHCKQGGSVFCVYWLSWLHCLCLHPAPILCPSCFLWYSSELGLSFLFGSLRVTSAFLYILSLKRFLGIPLSSSILANIVSRGKKVPCLDSLSLPWFSIFIIAFLHHQSFIFMLSQRDGSFGRKGKGGQEGGVAVPESHPCVCQPRSVILFENRSH